MYFIHDFNFKEIIFGFNSFNEAELYFVKNNLLDRLNLFFHSIMTKSITEDENNNLEFLIIQYRDIEAIISNINEIDETTEINYIKAQLNLGNIYLANTPFKPEYSINLTPDSIRTYKLK